VVTAVLGRARAADFVELTKPGIVSLILVTVAAGYYMGASGIHGLALFHTLFGAALVASGSNALNQIAERDTDALMLRTRSRPLPAGRLGLGEAQVFAWGLGGMGVAYLTALVGPLVGALAAATLVSYVFLYTPLKRHTTLNTLVGAVPGALPIVGGWVAARGTIEFPALVLFAVLYLWQMPHFLALAWMLREDYARAGIKMLSIGDDGSMTFRQAVGYSAALLPVTLVPSVLGAAGIVYFFGAVALALWLLWEAWMAGRSRTNERARRLFLTTVAYLPALLVLMMLDKLP
jgi:protoheme IX farnesyltransferase